MKRRYFVCKGRISHASLDYESRFPALLPKDSLFTKLVVEDCHVKLKHGLTKDTLAEVRSKYWIIKGRQLIRKIVHGCTVCRKFKGRCYKLPPVADLPSFRLEESIPFLNIGVDFAGPLYIKGKTMDEVKKTYIALFICCTTRACHLELVPELSADTFLLCLQRFIARRGVPKLINSDNAKTLKLLITLFRSLRVVLGYKHFYQNLELLGDSTCHSALGKGDITKGW